MTKPVHFYALDTRIVESTDTKFPHSCWCPTHSRCCPWALAAPRWCPLWSQGPHGGGQGVRLSGQTSHPKTCGNHRSASQSISFSFMNDEGAFCKYQICKTKKFLLMKFSEEMHSIYDLWKSLLSRILYLNEHLKVWWWENHLFSLKVPGPAVGHWPYFQALHFSWRESWTVWMARGYGCGCKVSQCLLQVEWVGHGGGPCQSFPVMECSHLQVSYQTDKLCLQYNTWYKFTTFILDRAYVQHCLDVFGAERCMFGSDWPVCKLAGAEHGQVRTI